MLIQNRFSIAPSVAKEIAKLFIADMRSEDAVNWDDDTAITDVTYMYDVDDFDMISGYLFKLTRGYVVVAASLLSPSLITEWSDAGTPVTDMLDAEEDEKILYGGGIHYYKAKSGDNTMQSVDGISVKASDLVNVISEAYSISNVPDVVMQEIRRGVFANDTGDASAQSGFYGEIDNPITHAKLYYGNSMKFSGEYCNRWESCVYNVCVTGYSDHDNCCGPVAISNLLRLIANRRGYTRVKNTPVKDLLSNVILVGTSNFYYNIYGGTPFQNVKPYINKAFQNYGIYVNVTGSKMLQYGNIVDTFTERDNLMMIMMLWHPYYHYHHVTGYAYTRISNNVYDKIYLKILDGWSTEPRYLLLDTVAADGYVDVSYD